MSKTIPSVLITTYLEMLHPPQAPVPPTPTSAHVSLMARVDLPYYLFLYREVGYQWHWRDRLLMPPAELASALSQASVYVLYAEGVPAGYIELTQVGQDCEIAYFGLREAFHGKGLGKYLLAYGVAQAWQRPNVARLWVHTCNLDGDNALPTYQKAGFMPYEVTQEPMPTRYADG